MYSTHIEGKYFLQYALNTFLYYYSGKVVLLIYCEIDCLYLSIFCLVCG